MLTAETQRTLRKRRENPLAGAFKKEGRDYPKGTTTLNPAMGNLLD
jgi:hypothetical protein